MAATAWKAEHEAHQMNITRRSALRGGAATVAAIAVAGAEGRVSPALADKLAVRVPLGLPLA
jgi:hypothetical protein